MTMTRKTPTIELLKEMMQRLRLKGMARALEMELERAERQGVPLAAVILHLLEHEATYQRERSLANRVKNAHLPWPWTLDSFPFERQPGVNKAQILALAGLDFIKRNQNLLLIGKTGVGKSGIAIGLLREACLNGYNGTFYSAQVLLDELYASLADRSTSRLIKKLSRLPVMIIDELSYMTLKPEQCNAFFRLMDQRYNRASSIITSNLDPSEWHTVFHNRNMLEALLDRLQHHCIKIHIDGPSLRTPVPEAPADGAAARKKNRNSATSPTDAA
jgi:DNA replication protein DnaC